MLNLTAELRSRPYPGRVCVIARARSGGIRLVYALTGRSAASRARSLRYGADEVEVVDIRPLGEHDMLRHYVAAVRRGSWLVLGNGDHVEPLAGALPPTDGSGQAQIEAAWTLHLFEPDPPIYTPRIWVATYRWGPGHHELWAGSVSRDETGSPRRRLWHASRLLPGEAVVLSTYAGAIDAPQPSADLTEVKFDAEAGAEQLLEQVWAGLDPALRVAAIVLDPDEPVGAARAITWWQ